MKPFVKWAGGKKQILPQILDKIKEQASSFDRNSFCYIEPFVGGGAVFIALKNPNSIINDLNKELITAYRVIRDNPYELMKILDEMKQRFFLNRDEYYCVIRHQDRLEEYKDFSDLQIAARMIFLNKTCFNGLYRVNSEGFFNTPIGKGNIRSFYDRRNILQLSNFLKTIPEENIMNGSYKKAIERSEIGDVVYVDPPYDYTENDGFTKYQKEGFTLEDLKELKEECDKAVNRESVVVISNNDTKNVRKVFSNDTEHLYQFYYIENLKTKRNINCKGNLRDIGEEIIIVGIPCGFPKIKEINKLVEYIRVKQSDLLKNEELLCKRFRVSKSRCRDILLTMFYFNIIDAQYNFTQIGKHLRKVKKDELNYHLKKVIVSKEPFKTIYEFDIANMDNKMSNIDIANLIKKNCASIKNGLLTKRTKIAESIIQWCLLN